MSQRSVPVPLQNLDNLQLPHIETPEIPNVHIPVITCGRHGRHGLNGGHGFHGHSGQTGQHGENGTRATPASLTLSVRDDNICIFVRRPETAFPESEYQLPLGDPRTSMFLDARGGNGGHGGAGGNGGDGMPGRNGRPATQTRAAENGGPGQDGGNGGGGGNGGHAGHGATIDLAVSQADTDLLMLLKTPPNVLAGYPGHGGPGGAAGRGGRGGRGGDGYRWRETRGDGTTYYRSRPGAYSGPPGRDGVPGSPGCAGNMGKDGTFRIHVEGDATYPGRYDIIICTDVVAVDMHSYGIIEPGTRVALQYAVRNCGVMPTPALHDIIMSVRQTDLISPVQLQEDDISGSIPLQRVIRPEHGPLQLSKPLHVRIQDIETPTVGPPLCIWTRIFHSATVTRVNQTIPTVDNQATTIAIAYPLQMSYVFGHVSVVPGGEGFIAWEVKNISEKQIGMDARLSRSSSTRLEIRNLEKAALIDSRGRSIFDEESEMGVVANNEICPAVVKFGKVTSEKVTFYDPQPEPDPMHIPIIEPGQTLRFSRAISIENVTPGSGEIAPIEHHSLPLTAHLNLGHPIMLHSQDEIQVRPFQIQVAAPFTYQEGETVALLIVNNRTTANEISLWRELMSSVLFCSPSSVSIWNVSLYGGFSFKYRVGPMEVSNPEGGRQSMARLFGGRGLPIVLLNNSCTPDRVRVDKSECSTMERMYHDELRHAAKDHGCRTYIAGSRSGLHQSRMILHVPVDDLKPRAFDNLKLLGEGASFILWPTHPLVNSAATKGKTESPKEAESAAVPADLKGLLYKQKNGKKGKVRRCFVLRKDEGKLLYYKKENSPTPSGSFPLKDCCILDSPEGLQIQTPSRLLVLHPDSKTTWPSLGDWETAIREVIDQSQNPKSGNTLPAVDQAREISGFDTSRPGEPEYYCFAPVVQKTSSSENSLKKMAEDLYFQMSSSYPELPVLVVYKYVEKENQERNRGVGVTSKNIGQISVYGSVPYETGNVFCDVSERGADVEAGDTFVHEGVSSKRNVYSLLKTLAFDKKMSLLRGCNQNGDFTATKETAGDNERISLLVDAILSDVADELSLFCHRRVSTGEKAKNLLKKKTVAEGWAARMKRINVVANAEIFGEVHLGSYKFEEIFRMIATIELVVLNLVPVTGKVLKLGVEGEVYRAAKPLIEQMKSNLSNKVGIEQVKEMKNSEGMTLKELESTWKKKGLRHMGLSLGLKEIMLHFRSLHDLGECEGSSDDGWRIPKVLSEREFMYMRENMTRVAMPDIKEDCGIMKNDDDRRSAATKFLPTFNPSEESVESFYK